MNAFTLHIPNDRFAGVRWTAAAVVIVAVHAGLIAAAVSWYTRAEPAGSTMPAIMVDMSPVSAAPEIQPRDDAPGPEMQQADDPAQSPPEPMRQSIVEDQIAPTPPVEKPIVEAPPEQKAEPAPPPPEQQPEPDKTVPDAPKPPPEEPKPVRTEVKKKPNTKPPAPLTSAPTRAARLGSLASPVTGSSATAMANYNQIIAARLQRFKQYPSAARAASEEGRTRVLFTLDRNGRLLSSRLTKSSGHAALDAEALAVLQRAQPFPPFPPEQQAGTASFEVPLSFGLR